MSGRTDQGQSQDRVLGRRLASEVEVKVRQDQV